MLDRLAETGTDAHPRAVDPESLLALLDWTAPRRAGRMRALLVGWALAQRPYLIAPDVTIAGAAAPAVALELTLVIVGGGSLLLIPSIYYLFRVFKP